MFRSDAGEFNKHLPYKDILKGGQKPEFYTSKPDGIGHQVGDIFLRRECARTPDWEAGETSWLAQFLKQLGLLVRKKDAPHAVVGSVVRSVHVLHGVGGARA